MDTPAVFDRLAGAVQESGALALKSQGTVKNEGKVKVGAADDSERLKAMRSAKTVIDEQVQEILLQALLECYPDGAILVDGEEKTPSLTNFSTSARTSVIIDPIDGTLEYLEGTDAYSVCIAIIEDERLSWAIVYFPARDVAYAVAPDGKAYEYAGFSATGTAQAHVIELPANGPRVLYKTRRVPPEFEQRFVDAGFEVRALDNYVQGLLATLTGDALGYISCEPQMRDILIGPVIGTSVGGFMCDWQGKEISWPQSGRLKEAFFGNAALEAEFRELLK